jgi:hypothetical protein
MNLGTFNDMNLVSPIPVKITQIIVLLRATELRFGPIDYTELRALLMEDEDKPIYGFMNAYHRQS